MGPNAKRALFLGSSFLSGAAYAFAPYQEVEIPRVAARDPRQDGAKLSGDFVALGKDMRAAASREKRRA